MKPLISYTLPIGDGEAIVADTDLDQPTRGISVDTEGSVHMTLEGGREITPFLVAGVVHAFRVTRIHSDSTADGFWGYY